MPAFVQQIPGFGFISNGTLGVTVFFVISGFLITHLLVKEEDDTGRINFGRFYLRRAFRIFPAFYVYIGFIAILWVTGILVQDGRSFLAAATYVWNYYPKAYGWYIAHVWSLCVEEQFYLLWPACVLLFGSKKALKIALGVIALAPLSRVITYYAAPQLRAHESMMLHTRIDTLLFGCVLAILWKNERFQRKLRLLFHPVIAIATTLLLVFGSALLWQSYSGAYGLTLGMTLDAALIAFLIAYLVQNPQTYAGRVLNSRVLRHVGVISYSLYLWQQFFLGPWLGRFPLNILLAVLAAELSFWIVERPTLRLRDRVERKLSNLRAKPALANAATELSRT
jgi:peptidoglycan/LPS O-acetylase OafA/YrhL